MVWAQRLSGRYWQSQFWVGVVIYLASPTFGFFGSVAFHDHLLIFLCLLSGHFFITYLTAWETRGKLSARQPLSRGDRPRARGAHQVQRDLPRARRRRGHRLQPQLPAAAARSAPLHRGARSRSRCRRRCSIWNFSDGFASFRFHLSDRHGGGYWLSNPGLLAVLGVPARPRCSCLALHLHRHRSASSSRGSSPGLERTARRLAVWVFWLSTLHVPRGLAVRLRQLVVEPRRLHPRDAVRRALHGPALAALAPHRATARSSPRCSSSRPPSCR